MNKKDWEPYEPFKGWEGGQCCYDDDVLSPGDIDNFNEIFSTAQWTMYYYEMKEHKYLLN